MQHTISVLGAEYVKITGDSAPLGQCIYNDVRERQDGQGENNSVSIAKMGQAQDST